MARGNGISGLAIAFATAGGILVYAGFRGTNPIQALKDVSSGSPVGITSNPTSVAAELGSIVAGVTPGIVAAGVSAAAQKYAGDKYSQARRTQSGYSDCSSFCDKILRDIGIPPPTKWAATANYRISPAWKNLPLRDTLPGDIAINGHHMVMITAAGGTAAIGQQNPRVNVRTGTVANLMSNDFVCKRYTKKG
jgi:hypothetical protein